MKKIEFSKVWKTTLAFVLSISFLSTVVMIPNISATESFDIEDKVTTNEEKTQAIINLDVASVSENYTIESVENPDGTMMDMVKDSSFTVGENGTFKFLISYRLRDTEELLTFTKEVEVNTLESPQEEIKDEVAQPRATVVDGGVKLQITNEDGSDWDDTQGWQNNEVKTITVSFDYGNSTTAGKELEINIPEGMTITSLYTKNGTDISKTSGTILSEYASDFPLAQGIASMTIPATASNGTAATFGKIKYKFTPGMEKNQIVMKAKVNPKVYYGPHKLNDKISAVATQGSPLQEVGTVEQEIVGTGRTAAGAFNIAAASSSKTTPGGTYRSDQYRMNQTNGNTLFILGKKMYFTYYYVPEAEEVYTPNGWKEISRDDVNHSITYEFLNTYFGEVKVAFVSKMPDNIAAGTYSATKKSEVKFVWYDDSESNVVLSGRAATVEIVDTFEEKAVITGYSYATNTDMVGQSSVGASFMVGNKQAGTIENQVYELEIEETYDAKIILIPYQTVAGNEPIKNIEFKTNKRGWSEYTGTLLNHNGSNKKVTKKMLGITDEDEHITGFRANVGNFKSDYMSGSSDAGPLGMTYILGSLSLGAVSANISASIYQAGNRDATLVSKSVSIKETENTKKARTIGSNTSGNYRDSSNAIKTSFTGGDVYEVQANLGLNAARQSDFSVKSIKNPEIYLRAPSGHTIDISSLEIKDNYGNVVEWSYRESTNSFGEKVYVIKTKNTVVGFYYLDDAYALKEKRINVNYKTSTKYSTSGIYKMSELINWGDPNSTAVSIWINPAYKDIYDMNGNGDTNEAFLGVKGGDLTIVEKKGVLVETALGYRGEEPLPAYKEGNNETVAYFTPGTSADYTVNIKNTSDVDADVFTLYIPIPKTGKNFGENFQDEAFKWDAVIENAIDDATGFTVGYSTNATESNYTTANYSTTLPANKSDVVMIKISANGKIPAGFEHEFKIPLKVDETFETATAGNKIGTRNVYNPVYRVENSVEKVTLLGTKVGTELVIAEIGGTVFNDLDADGLYNNEDTPVANHEVKLYKWNDVDSKYEPVLDSSNNQYTTTTDTNGVYNFDYATGIGYGKYAVEFVEKSGGVYQYTTNNNAVGKEALNSDAIIANDIPNPGDKYRGWAIDIDATKPEAKTIGAGFLEYNPPQDLKVKINETPNSVKVGSSILIGSEISPEFWENIKATSGAYTWSLDDPANINLVNNDDGTVTFTPTELAAPVASKVVNLTLVIKDTYGNTKESVSVPITILSNIAPTLTATDKVVYVGDAIVDYTTLISGVDVAGTNIAINPLPGALQNTVITNNIPVSEGKYTTAGTYEVTYEVKDIRGNKATATSILRIHEEPSVVATGATYSINDTGIDASVNGLASATWKEAPETVGEAVEMDITSSITKEVSGPSSDFTKAGLYEVTFSAADTNGKIGTKTVVVLVKDITDESDDGLTIHAENFVLENAEAKEMDVAKAITKGNVTGYEETYVNNVLTGIVELQKSAISVNQTQLENIKKATADGGMFKLKFTVTKGSKSVTKEVNVYVKAKGDVEDSSGTLLINAKSYTLDYSTAVAHTAADAVVSATATATLIVKDADGVVLEFKDVSNTIVVDAGELAAINATTRDGDVFDLTFNVSEGEKTVAKKVEVFVYPDETNLDDDLTISANDFALTYADAKVLTEQLVVDNTHSNAKATKIKKDADGTIVSFDDVTSNIKVKGADLTAIKNVTTQGGVFSVELSITEAGKTKKKSIEVFVIPENGVEDSDIIMSANAITLTKAQAKSLTGPDSIAKAKVKAYALRKNEEGKVVGAMDITSNVTIDEAQLTAIKGAGNITRVYNMTFSVEDAVGSSSITKKAMVLGGNAISTNSRKRIAAPGDDLVLDASNIVLSNAEGISIDDAGALLKAEVAAFSIKYDAYGEIVDFEDASDYLSVDATELTAINGVGKGGGLFELTFHLNNGYKTLDLKVSVLVKAEGEVTNSNVSIGADGFAMDYTEAATIDTATAIAKANANAYETEVDDAGMITGFRDLSSSISVNAEDLQAIKEAPTQGGVYNLRYSATGASDTAEKAVSVFVKPANGGIIDPTNSIMISGNGFTIKGEDVRALDSNKAMELANVSAYKLTKDASGNITGASDISGNVTVNQTELEAIQNNTETSAIYNLTFTVMDGAATVETTVPVLVVNEIPTGNIYIEGNDIELAEESAKGLTEVDVLTNANAKAYSILRDANGMITGIVDITASIKVDTNELKALQAIKGGGKLPLTLRVVVGSDTHEIKIAAKVRAKAVTTTTATTTEKGPKTFDSSNVKGYATLLLLAGGLLVMRKKRYRTQK